MDEKVKKIHSASMRILEKTGIRLDHPDVLELVKKNGVKVSGRTVFFREDKVMNLIAKAPRSFVLYARNPKFDMLIGDGHLELGPGYGCPAIIEKDGQKRAAVFQDYCQFLKLVHQCEYFKINGGVLVQPNDLPPQQSLPLMIYSAIVHSDKCIMGIPGNRQQVEAIMDLAGIVFGGREGLLEKPRILTLINTTSPLKLDNLALDTMLVCAENKQPIIVTPGPMAGATGPLTLAGNLALGNAEALALIAITQMVRAGTPVVYGLQATTTDMRSGAVSIGSPGCALQMVYSARLAQAYGLPSRCGGTNTDAKSVSVQSGYESMLSMLTVCQANPDFVLHSAGILDGYGAMSYEQFVIDLEIIGMIKYFLADLEVNSDTLQEELIHAVGPGGEFLSSEHTTENCRKVPWLPEVSLRGVLPPEETPDGLLADNISKKLERMLEAYRKPELDPKIQTRLAAYLETRVGVKVP